MLNINSRLQSESVSDIISDYIQQLKVTPTNSDIRSDFIELLCIDGQLERADQQLSLLIKQCPEYLVGGNNLRQLIHAAQARVDFFNGNATAKLLVGDPDSFQHFVELIFARNQGLIDQITHHAEQLNAKRKPAPLTVNGVVYDDCRDLDDLLAGYIEVFGTDGQYYLLPFSSIHRLQFMPISSLVEMIWRKVDIDVIDGPSGDAFIPMTYLTSLTDAEKLGKETDWREISSTPVVIGQGQKMWLVGEEAMAVMQCELIEGAAVN